MAVHVGSAFEEDIEIYNTDGNLDDPASLYVALVAPDGTQTNYVYGIDPEVTRTGVGLYTFISPPLDQVTSRNRLWWSVWVATGLGITVTDERSHEVCALHGSIATPPSAVHISAPVVDAVSV